MAVPRIHRAQRHFCPIAGLEAVTLASNAHFPRHAHDTFGIGVMRSGGHRSWSALGQVEALAGDVILVNPGEIHDGAPLGAEARHWRMLYFHPDLVHGEVGAGELLRPVARDPLLAEEFFRLFTAVTDPGCDGLERELHLLRMLHSAFRRQGSAPRSVATRSPEVSRALERIESAPEEPVSLSELAALAGVSRFQLLRGFARQVGITPHAYLIQRRVRLARRLLDSGVAIADCAARAGFADQSHLTRAFVRHLGMTPGRYSATRAISFKTPERN